MYTPSYFKIEDLDIIELFLKENSFALMFSYTENSPSFTHLPFTVTRSNSNFIFASHLAKANPHALALQEDAEVRVIFSGPNAYISPLWYHNQPNVPTWNYMVAHVQGKIKLLNSHSEKWNLLLNTVEFYKDAFSESMQNLPGEYVNAMMNEIIAFEIREVSFEVKFKLNQNKPKEDILGVIENLMRNGLSNSPLVSWMEIINHKKLQNE